MSSRQAHRRLVDIVENVDRILEYVAGLDQAGFASDIKTVDATERCLERIAEAIVKIGRADMTRIAPKLEIEQVRGLGNVLRHAYDEIDLALLYGMIQRDLPPLRAACVAALAD